MVASKTTAVLRNIAQLPGGMTMRRLVLAFATCPAPVAGVTVAQQQASVAQRPAPPTPKDAPVTPAPLSLETLTAAKSNTAFALDLYGRPARQEGDPFFPPYGTSTAPAMTYAGARGETATQMSRAPDFVLHPNALHPAFAGLRKALQGGRPVVIYDLYNGPGVAKLSPGAIWGLPQETVPGSSQQVRRDPHVSQVTTPGTFPKWAGHWWAYAS
jgi:hypothetical protein